MLLQIPFGSRVMIGPPANPPDPQFVQLLATFLSSTKAFSEAHLVQCIFADVPNGNSQVIVVVPAEEGVAPGPAVESLVKWLDDMLPKGQTLYVWPMKRSSSLLPLVRDSERALAL